MGLKTLIKNTIKMCIPYGILVFYHRIKKTGKYQEESRLYFSEQGEDILLEQYLEKKQGFYVDIGAYNPDRVSVTKKFYLQGWSGINIEPNPVAIKQFIRKRTRDININMGVADVVSELDFYFLGETSTCNTFDKERYETEYKSRGGGIIKIKVMPINNILEKYLPRKQHIDFINIDVENYEMKILKSFDFKKYGPDYFLIEDLTFTNNDIDFMGFSSSKLYKLMNKNGYIVVAKTHYTILFKRIRDY
ncbi:MAG: FkbM family methyltransferase [Spirochaetaceae bacterium]|nr:FkbM family methyltransferase [Spirochaetaceae bacterium]